MRRLFACLILTLAIPAAPVLADDLDFDALEDAFPPDEGTINSDASVAIVDAGGGIAEFQARLAATGHVSTVIPVTSGYATLMQYDIVILPVSHATPAYYNTLNGLAQDYHDYVDDGGKLWIGQPNPYQMPGNTADITWAPYGLTINNAYNGQDCPVLIVDPAHCIAQGVSGADLPFPGDTVTQMGAEWHVVTRGLVTNNPSVFMAGYGQGACLVELGHPSTSALCAYTDAGFARLVECLMESGPTPVESATWGRIKSYFD